MIIIEKKCNTTQLKFAKQTSIYPFVLTTWVRYVFKTKDKTLFSTVKTLCLTRQKEFILLLMTYHYFLQKKETVM